METISILDNTSIQALTYCVAVAGVLIAFRICRYPDLTADGSFLLGCACFAAIIHAGLSWAIALLVSTAAGVLAGIVTAGLNAILGVSRLLTGILTTMASYSLAFRILQGQSNLGVSAETPFTWVHAADEHFTNRFFSAHPWEVLASALYATVFAGTALLILRSELGLFIRANGENPSRIADLGRRPAAYTIIGLGLANGLIAAAGAMLTARQGFADIGSSFGVVITLVAALVVGEETLRRLGWHWRSAITRQFTAVIGGTFLYFLMYLVVLRMSIRGLLPFSIRPTDLKLISALFVIAVIAINRRRASSTEDILPL